MFVEERLGGDEESRRAITALRSAQIGERFLQRMQTSVVDEPFDGRDVRALAIDAEHEARQHGPAVEQDGTGAALAKLAAVLRPAQIQILTQDLEQRFVRSERDFGRLAVDGQGDVGVFHAGSIR